MENLWADIALGSGILLVCGVIFRYLYCAVEDKVDKQLYEARHKQLEDDMMSGKKRFDEIDHKLEEHTGLLHSLDKNVALIAQTVARLEKCAIKRKEDVSE